MRCHAKVRVLVPLDEGIVAHERLLALAYAPYGRVLIACCNPLADGGYIPAPEHRVLDFTTMEILGLRLRWSHNANM